ncbi:hypothetical protein GCM10009097_26620 [Pigmentiphaga daeguensis]|uniref:Uncharacterized protein n=1 Tax=Pigmentiphaga daeguensis TaxID=414049 RepID=A0ABN1BYW3_9BURK
MLASQQFLDMLQGFLGIFGLEPVALERFELGCLFDHRAGKHKTAPHGPWVWRLTRADSDGARTEAGEQKAGW